MASPAYYTGRRSCCQKFLASKLCRSFIMEQHQHRMSDYGDLVLEIDKLIRADRASLSVAMQAQFHQPASNTDCYNQIIPSQTGGNPVIHVQDRRPRPTLWSQLPSPLACAECPPGSPDNRGQDMRQVRLFKTRFCSYGLDCPYLAKGKCLYAHTKDEIRFRPPPPVGYKQPIVRSSSGSPAHMARRDMHGRPDQSPVGSTESVWTLPESPKRMHGTAWENAVGCCYNGNSPASLFDCLASKPPNSRTRSTIGSPSLAPPSPY